MSRIYVWRGHITITHYHDELERHEAVGHLTATELEALQGELALWREMIKKLDEIANTHGFAVAHPVRNEV